jgi:glycosyltransferase involved in cell wall biosynthesis
MPLSVLEAMACNLPVVTTRFGGLADCFADGDGFRFVDSAARIAGSVESVRDEVSRTREKAAPYTWSGVVGQLLSEVEQLVGRR